MGDESSRFTLPSSPAEAKLLKRLAKLPIVNVFGVVHPGGASGSKSQGTASWTLLFDFDAWRIEAGEFQTQKLKIRRRVSESQLQRHMRRIKPYSVLRIRAHVGCDPQFGTSEALLEKVGRIDRSDVELNDFAAQLREPVTFEHRAFGMFTLDRRSAEYAADTKWCGSPVSLSLTAQTRREIDLGLRVARALWKSQRSWNRRIRDFALKELLPVKNSIWLREGERKLTAKQFKDKMTLTTIVVDPDGSFSFWYDDGDLFWGHSIDVRGSLSEGPTDADTPG